MSGKVGMHRKLLNPAAMEVIRAKIDAEKILNKLTKHVVDNEEMSSTQVTAALGLLKKRIPDLQAIEHSGEIDTTRSLAAILESISK